MTAEELAVLVQDQISSISDIDVRSALAQIIVKPSRHQRKWDYGAEGQTYPCWTVAEDMKTDTRFLFSEFGHGETHPWGIVSFSSEWFGMDCGWFANLEDAFCESFSVSPLRIWEIMADNKIIEKGLTMDEAFAKQKVLNQGGERKFHVSRRNIREID